MAIPEIRFAEFNNEWEQVTLGNRATFSKGSGYSKNDFKNEGISFIHYGRLYTSYESLIESVDTFADLKEGSLLSRGREVLVPASGETAEDIARASALSESGVILGGDLNVIYPDSSISPHFLALSLSNGDVRRQVIASAQGNVIVHVKNDDLKKLRIYIPLEEEQLKIEELLHSLERQVNYSHDRLGMLRNLKSTMLVKMFPQVGSTRPEIRFGGFDGEWKTGLLGKRVAVKSAARVHKDEWQTSGVPFFRTSDVTAAVNREENTKAYISFELYENLTAKSGKLQKGDLLVVGGGSIGTPYLVPNNEPLYSKDADLLWVQPRGAINSEYLAWFFISPRFSKHLRSISHAGTISHYTIEQAQNTPVPLPSPAEQEVIGNYFQNLDTLIRLEEDKLSKLKNLKSALLDKMFV